MERYETPTVTPIQLGVSIRSSPVPVLATQNQILRALGAKKRRRSPHPRDSQRARLYTAERAAFPGFYEPAYRDIRGAAAYVRRIVRSKTFGKLWVEARGTDRGLAILRGQLHVGPGTGCRRAFARGYEIQLPKWARTKAVMIHEIAHLVAPTSVLPQGCPIPERHAIHGWLFARCYLKLVRRFLGREAHNALRESFRKHRVRYRKPRKAAPLAPAACPKIP